MNGPAMDAKTNAYRFMRIRVVTAWMGACSNRKKGARTMTIESLICMFFGVCFFSLGLLVGYGMCEDKQNRRKEGEKNDES